MLGEHNREVATGIMGFSEDEYLALEAEGAFGTTPDAAGMKPPPQDIGARLTLGPAAASARAREVDPHAMDRLRERFGDEYGREVRATDS